ncbi:MAG: c-type cytochrome, partial [Planctomycetota bacterium]|nr:c-type cytochrome [Planctomycetota bacterium]
MRPIRAISRFAFVILIFAGLLGSTSSSQERSPLEQELLAEPANSIAEDARELGDATRGAVLFHQPWLSCTQCHAVTDGDEPLGPHLGKMDPATTNEQLIMAILEPSREIKKGYETTLIETVDGATLTGLLVSRSNDQIRLRDPSTQRLLTLPTEDIDTIEASPLSIMPNGLIAQLNSRQQFLDLLAYLMEIRDGGLARARQLQPLPSQYASQPLPEYEAQIDHAGMLGTLDNEAYQRGEAIYQRLCVNCHGTASEPGSLPTSLKFASGKFKNGHDPFSMYQTLTRGFGLMVAQRWMVPQQKYDVIHYIRESYLREHNPDQYFEVTDKYLAELPKGDSRGPEPSNIEPWQQMDYGPSLIGTFEIGNNGQNFAYKGNAIRLDAGPGGVASGR